MTHPDPIRRVLIVDDTPTARKLLRHCLEPTYDVVGEAANGHEALQVAAELEPDVVLMDLIMPCMGGIEAIRLLKEVSPSSEVVVVSCRSEWDAMREAMVAGARDFLTKPFHRTEVHAVLDRLQENRAHPPAAALRAHLAGSGAWVFLAPGTGGGRTSSLLGMAGALRSLERSVVVVDLDLQFGDLEVYLGLGAHGPTLATLLEEDHWLETATVRAHLREHGSGVRVLAAPRSLEEACRVDPTRFPSLLEALAREFDHVLVDLPPGLAEWSTPILDRARYLFPVAPLLPERLRGLRRLVGGLGDIGYSSTKVRPLVQCGAEGPRLDWLQAAGMQEAHIHPFDPEAARAALHAGLPVTNLPDPGPLARVLRRFTGSLVAGTSVARAAAA